MSSSPLFKSIGPLSTKALLDCFKPEIRRFSKGDTILVYSNSLEHLCVLTKGSAHLYSMDSDGEYSFLEYYAQGDVFGELFSTPGTDSGLAVQADSRCEVMFIRFPCVYRRCTRACQHHSQLLLNLFELTSQHSRRLSGRLGVLSHKTLRKKLLAYFDLCRAEKGEHSFDLELSYTRLADYICADRSSMMRELRHMEDEGLIKRQGKHISLL
ncbi:MAG: Crp/Fnr family transcriptional regulator [Oscillospiraceae bacterium]|nr:Crp/Fnr family transcriptional regulator [Oscillospiraceae bacterium]